MKLTSLTVQGFKSFAEHTEFDFTNAFTAVVGPNGSGKSNIADAIRWVLGEQSLKLLRAKSSAELIFGGSHTLARGSMAKVELHLDNHDKAFPVDYEEVVISRTLYGSGESEYLLNGAMVRLQDITLMLARARFGQKSYAVIGQGMITDFLNASPQERKIFFDEATGVREFQIQRDQSINKLLRTEQNLLQAQTVVQELTPHVQSLERQVKKLQQREELEAQLQTVQIQYFGSIWHELVTQRTTLLAQHTLATKQLEQLDTDMSAVQTQIDGMSAETSAPERYEQLQQDLNRQLEQKSGLMKEQALLRAKLEIEQQKQGELSQVWLQRKADELAGSRAQLQGAVQLLTEQQHTLATAIDRKQKQLHQLQQECDHETEAITQLREQIASQIHTMTIPEVTDVLHGIFADHEQLLQALLHTTSMEEFKQVQQQAKSTMKKFAQFMDRLTADTREAVDSLRLDLAGKEQQLTKLVHERQQLQDQINDQRVQVSSIAAQQQINQQQLDRVVVDLASVQADIDAAAKTSTAGDRSTALAEVSAGVTAFEQTITALDEQMSQIRSQLNQFHQAEADKKTQLVEVQGQLRALQRQYNTVRQDANSIEIQVARLDTRQTDVQAQVEQEVVTAAHEAVWKYAATDTIDRTAAQQQLLSLQRKLASIGTIDDATVAEYESSKQRFDFLTEQIGDLETTIESLEQVIDELDASIHRQFQKNFKKINEGFEQYFKVLFNGGEAKLLMLTQEAAPDTVVDEPTDVESNITVTDAVTAEVPFLAKRKKTQRLISGIDVTVVLPGKKVRNITALSGGEKSLVAIALLCSIIANNPSPFVVLDEVEAALDEENSEKLSAILSQLATKTQLIVITHNRVTMRAADVLYGVTVGPDGKSHILSVALGDAESLVEE